jgi:hypothetical protein
MTDAPPPIAQPAPPAKTGADFVVLSRDDHNDIVTTQDLPLVLMKAGRTEQALVRQALFISASVMVTRPTGAAANTATPDSYRWTYEGFMQRQLCFTSMTGQFSCTVPELTALPNVEKGEAPVLPILASNGAGGADDDPFPAATAAQDKLAAALKARSTVLFEQEKRLKVDPILKASGVTATLAGPAAPRPR